MKNLFRSTVVVVSFLVVLASCSSKTNQENARLDAANKAVKNREVVANADIVWTGFKITGDKHTGTLSLKSNSLKFSGNKLSGGTFVVDMSTLDNTDLEGEWHGKLVGHLKSDDFFGIEKHPTSKFEITGVKQGATNNDHLIEGNLTIKDTTLPISFTAKTQTTGNQIVMTANFNVDRTKFDVKYGSSNFFEGLGDKAIKDEFNLDIKIVSEVDNTVAQN